MLTEAQEKTIRDEQFWFTVAVVGFNTTLIRESIPSLYAWLGGFLITAFGFYLIITRWVAYADLMPGGEPNAKELKAWHRFLYSWQLAKIGCKGLPFVFAECSGSLFFLAAMFVSFLGVVSKHWPATLADAIVKQLPHIWTGSSV